MEQRHLKTECARLEKYVQFMKDTNYWRDQQEILLYKSTLKNKIK